MNAPAPDSDRTLAILTPILALFFGVFGPLVVWLVKKSDGDTFLVRAARETLNFQITVLIAIVIAYILVIILIGALLVPLVMLWHLVFCILAAVKYSNGQEYRYPFILRLVS